jgi:Zn-dependent alcohol dehydrogenase
MATTHAGAGPIVAVDTQPAKLELALRAGATHAFDPHEAERRSAS